MVKPNNTPLTPEIQGVFPESVQHKSRRAVIYRIKHRQATRYEIRYHDNEGVMQRHTFNDYPEAKKQALAILKELGNGGLDFLPLRGRERFIYEDALKCLAPLGLTLDEAVRQFSEATGLLNGTGTLRQAVEHFLMHQPRHGSKMVRAIVDEYLQSKKAAKEVGLLHLRDLRLRLTRFANAFQCYIETVNTPSLMKYMDGLKMSSRSRKNELTTIGALLNYAKQMGYLPDNHPGISKVPKPRRKAADVQVFTPEEMAVLLHGAKADLLPALAITAFAGIRAEEIKRLRWEHVHLGDPLNPGDEDSATEGSSTKEGYIEVPASLAKTGVRRMAPVPPNLRAWLLPYAGTQGPVVPYVNLANQYIKLAKRCKVKWNRNALRHSFASYRVATTKNVPQTALEAGNSPPVIQRDYVRVVTEELGKQWFSIMPPEPGKVVPMLSTNAALNYQNGEAAQLG